MAKPIIMRQGAGLDGLYDFIRYIENNIDKSDSFYDLIHSGTMVEIGAYQGESTDVFSKYFRYIFAVDMWEDGFDPHPAYVDCPMSEVEKAFDARMMHKINVTKVKSDSKSFAENYDKLAPQFHVDHLDLVYIDGNHTYEAVKEDIELWLPKIRKGGFISGHDYTKHFKGVQQAVNEKFGAPDHIFKDGSWIVKIK